VIRLFKVYYSVGTPWLLAGGGCDRLGLVPVTCVAAEPGIHLAVTQPRHRIGKDPCDHRDGVAHTDAALVVWRTAYGWLLEQPYTPERVYMLGTGERDRRLVNGVRQRA